LPNRVKKWFMLQVWRLQQVAQILTLALLALNLSLQVWGYVKWRNEFLANPISGVLLILLLLALGIWTFAILWDIRFKMWREQQAVLIERNPYAKERMAAKEIALYEIIWMPLLERLARDDPKIAAAASDLREWLSKLAKDDPVLERDLKELYEYIRTR